MNTSKATRGRKADATRRLYRLPEAADALGISLNTLRARVADGSISVVYTCGRRATKGKRITSSELDRYVAALESAARGGAA